MLKDLESLIVERDDGVVTVTMNRPARKNAANGAMWRELLLTFDDVASDRHDRVMVLTGAGDAFCSGADLGDPSDVAGRPGDPYLVQMRALGDVALRLHRFPKPTIAKVGGVAAGAGMSMALGCDLIVASESARFSQIFAKRGLSGFRCLVVATTTHRPAPGQGVGVLRRHHRCPPSRRIRLGQSDRAC
jgi:2-(1,2-epoxy-1,2-dihydrophenyl)acetyl-CoA isomerase